MVNGMFSWEVTWDFWEIPSKKSMYYVDIIGRIIGYNMGIWWGYDQQYDNSVCAGRGYIPFFGNVSIYRHWWNIAAVCCMDGPQGVMLIYMSWGLHRLRSPKINPLGFGEHGSVQNLGVDGIILKSGTPKSIIINYISLYAFERASDMGMGQNPGT